MRECSTNVARVAKSAVSTVAASLFLAALVLLTSPGTGWAQVSGAISGRVGDASGGVLSGVTVTMKDAETGATRVVSTDLSGNYRVLSLPVGQYEIRAEKAGFKAAVRTGVKLEVGQEAVVNLRLDVGEVVQQIVVTEELPVVNTTTPSVSGLVGEREIKELPLNGRSFDQLITLNPGTVNYTALRSANTTTSNGNAIAADGQRPADNVVLFNGVEYTGSSQLIVSPGGVSGDLLGIDAVREFNVLTADYGAEYGKREGAQVSVVTQSGSNTLHGTLYEFVRNSALDGRNYFDQGSIPPFQQNQFGASGGGPIKKNQLFLFANYEGFRQSKSLSNVSVVPDAMARQGYLPNKSCVETPVSGLNPAMLPYMSFWPQPNGTELGGGCYGEAFSFNHPEQTVREDFGTVRTDYDFSPRDLLSGAYTIDDGNGTVPLPDPLFASALALRSQVFSLQETHNLSARALNTFTAGFSRASFANDSSPQASFDPNAGPFVQGRGPGGIVIGGGVTTTANGTITSAGPNNASSVWNHRNLFTYADSFQVSRGVHQISVGAWFQRLQDNEDTASRQLGQGTFSTLATFLQGTVGTFQVVPTATELGWRTLMGAWYAQDLIKLRPNLILRIGLRQEFDTGWNEEAGRAANFITGANGLLVTPPRVGDSVFTQNNAKWLFGPRVALAWDPSGRGTTAVHAGFGIHYSLIDALAFQLNSVPTVPPYNYNGQISFANQPFLPLIPIIPNVPPAPQCGTANAPPPPQCTIYAPQGVQANAKIPTLEEWNLTVERQLDRSTVLRVGYVGSFGFHQLVSIDPNSIPPQICGVAGGCAAGGINKTTSTVPQGAEYIPWGSGKPNVRPNPNLSGGFFWYSEGNSSYNALQVDVIRRFTSKLQFRANYTWSKSLDNNSALTGAQASNQPQMLLDRFNLRKDWGPSALNVEHQAHITATYELPFGRGQHWLGQTSGAAGNVVSGWVFNTITTIGSGFPFTSQVGTNISGDGDTRNPDRPSLNPAFRGPIVRFSPTQWFNPLASVFPFVVPSSGTYGDLGRGTLTGPGLAEVDVSLIKNTNITEKIALQFRAECFNVLNHTNFGPPNGIVFSGGSPSPSAGLITATDTSSRQIQFGLKLIY
ncbi:MAG: carboxypeptidase regulatory-like domain-containing protein [Terriglobales bacterium]